MKALIIEDEDLAAMALRNILEHQNIINFETVSREDSLENAVNFLSRQTPDVIFLDIHLGDGSGFEVLDAMRPASQVVFVTAYEEYALKAHDYNTAGYITKPFDRAAVYKILSKIKSHPGNERQFQRRFLVQEAGKLLSLRDSAIAYFYAEGKSLFIHTFSGEVYLYESTLAKVAAAVDGRMFFRINRNICLNIDAIAGVSKYSGQRLCVAANPPFQEPELGIIAKNSISEFKRWMDL